MILEELHFTIHHLLTITRIDNILSHHILTSNWIGLRIFQLAFKQIITSTPSTMPTTNGQ